MEETLMFDEPSKFESHTFIETFLNWDDAITWIDGQRVSYPSLAWEMSVSIANVNYAYRAGLSFRKIQIDFDFGDNKDKDGNERKAN